METHLLDFVGGFNVSDEGMQDEEPVSRHGLGELLFDRVRYLLLGLEHIVEVHLRDRGPHNVKDVAADLGS